MVIANKYKAQKVTIDGFSFDSRFEGRVYEALKFYFGWQNLRCHEAIPLLSPTVLYPNGKQWKVDFKVISNNSVILFEAKGCITSDTPWQVSVLETCNPELFNRLVLIFDNKNAYVNSAFRHLKHNNVEFMGIEFPQILTFAEFIAIMTRNK